MATVSLYRKYRSQTFDDLIGQDHVVRTIRNGISSGRIAHAYLFTGPRGTGKTSTARLLAKCLCATDGPTPTPDPNDPICLEIAQGSCVDVIEMDAASETGVDDVREKIIEAAQYAPFVARYKVFIIDEVHDLSSKAFDALLKTIEEPPPHVIFILATTEYSKVPPTIRSRCQKFEFHRASMGDLVARLTHVATQEGIEAEPAALTAIARMADGGFRDALTLLEQAIITADGAITLEQVYDQLGLVDEDTVDGILRAIRASEVPVLMDAVAAVVQRGRDPRSLVESLLHRLADLTRASYGVANPGGEASREAALAAVSSELGRETVLQLRADLAAVHKTIQDITLPRLWLEAELVRLSLEMARRAAAPAVTTKPATTAEEPRRPSTLASPLGRNPAESKGEPKPEKKPSRIPEDDPILHPERAEAPSLPPSVPEEAPKDEPAGNPMNPKDAWESAVRWLTTEKAGSPIAMRVSRSRYHECNEEEIVIAFEGQLDVDWLHDQPKRLSYLQQLLAEHGETRRRLRLVAIRVSEPVRPAAETVELSADGQRLYGMAKEILGPSDDPQIEP